jgi:hypothetical protein
VKIAHFIFWCCIPVFLFCLCCSECLMLKFLLLIVM